MYTHGGDANIDGLISGDDYSAIDFNVGTSADGWYNGDRAWGFLMTSKFGMDTEAIVERTAG